MEYPVFKDEITNLGQLVKIGDEEYTVTYYSKNSDREYIHLIGSSKKKELSIFRSTKTKMVYDFTISSR